MFNIFQLTICLVSFCGMKLGFGCQLRPIPSTQPMVPVAQVVENTYIDQIREQCIQSESINAYNAGWQKSKSELSQPLYHQGVERGYSLGVMRGVETVSAKICQEINTIKDQRCPPTRETTAYTPAGFIEKQTYDRIDKLVSQQTKRLKALSQQSSLVGLPTYSHFPALSSEDINFSPETQEFLRQSSAQGSTRFVSSALEEETTSNLRTCLRAFVLESLRLQRTKPQFALTPVIGINATYDLNTIKPIKKVFGALEPHLECGLYKKTHSFTNTNLAGGWSTHISLHVSPSWSQSWSGSRFKARQKYSVSTSPHFSGTTEVLYSPFNSLSPDEFQTEN